MQYIAISFYSTGLHIMKIKFFYDKGQKTRFPQTETADIKSFTTAFILNYPVERFWKALQEYLWRLDKEQYFLLIFEISSKEIIMFLKRIRGNRIGELESKGGNQASCCRD